MRCSPAPGSATVLAELPPSYLRKHYPFRLHLVMPPADRPAELQAVLEAAARAGGSRRWNAWTERRRGADVLVIGFLGPEARSAFGAWLAERVAA